MIPFTQETITIHHQALACLYIDISSVIYKVHLFELTELPWSDALLGKSVDTISSSEIEYEIRDIFFRQSMSFMLIVQEFEIQVLFHHVSYIVIIETDIGFCTIEQLQLSFYLLPECVVRHQFVYEVVLQYHCVTEGSVIVIDKCILDDRRLYIYIRDEFFVYLQWQLSSYESIVYLFVESESALLESVLRCYSIVEQSV